MEVLRNIKKQYLENKTLSIVIFYNPLGELIIDDFSDFKDMKQVNKHCMLNNQIYYFSENTYE